MVRVSPENAQAVFVSVTHSYKICTRGYIRPLWSGGRCFTKKKMKVIHIRIKAMHKECDSGPYCVQGGLQFDVPRSHTPDGDQPNLPAPYEHTVSKMKIPFHHYKSFPWSSPSPKASRSPAIQEIPRIRWKLVLSPVTDQSSPHPPILQLEDPL